MQDEKDFKEMIIRTGRVHSWWKNNLIVPFDVLNGVIFFTSGVIKADEKGSGVGTISPIKVNTSAQKTLLLGLRCYRADKVLAL